MMPTLADAQAVFLVSPWKPILVFIVFTAYAWIISARIDKLLDYYYLPRQQWNGIMLGAMALALGLVLVIPIFWIGLPLAVLVLCGALFGYVQYHNAKTPENAHINPIDMIKQRMEEREKDRVQESAVVTMLEPNGAARPLPDPNDPLLAAHQKLEEVLGYAMPRGAERLDMVVSGEKGVAVPHIDGVRYVLPSMDPRVGLGIIDYLKTHAGLDVQDRRKKQTGFVHFQMPDGSKHQMKITTAGSTKELTLTGVIDPEAALARDLATLGMVPQQIKQLQPVLESNDGVVLVSSPPRQGQTTTLYALLQQHDPYTLSIITLEERVAVEVEGVDHNELPYGSGPEAIGKKLAGLIRQDPSVVLVSKVPDSETAGLMARSTEDMRFYAGMRHEDTLTTLRAWLKAVGDPKLAARSVKAIVAQRLVRKLCTTCRAAYRPDEQVLRKLNLPPDRVSQFFKASGQVRIDEKKIETCPQCMGIGYKGRVGVFEVMVLDDTARQHLMSGDLEQLRAHLRKNKMLLLQEAGLFKVVDGSTSISELQRAMSKDADKPVMVPGPEQQQQGR